MSNRKKKIQKPNLVLIFLIRFVILALIASIVFIYMYARMERQYYDDIEAQKSEFDTYVRDSIVNDLLDSGKNVISEKCKNEISIRMAYLPIRTGVVAKIDYDGKLLLDNRPRVFLYINNRWYQCKNEEVINLTSGYQMKTFDPYAEKEITGPVAENYYINERTQLFTPSDIAGTDFEYYDPNAEVMEWIQCVFNDTDIQMEIPGVFEDVQFNNVHKIVIEVRGKTHVIHIRMSNPVFDTSFISYNIDKVKTLMWWFVAATLAVSIVWSIIEYYRRKSLYEVFAYRSSLTSKLAHDLKTPLMAISSYSENLALDPSGPKSTHYTEEIVKNVYYMNDMITSVLQLSVSENSRIIHNSEEVSLKLIVDTIISKLEPRIEEKKLVVDVSGLKEATPKTDSRILSNALTCLIENAVKYAVEGTTIDVISIKGGLISIRNNFVGFIDNEKQLMDPFVRGNTSRGELGGSGLGLAIAKEDLSALGYKLEIEIDKECFIASVKKYF
ncbi:MAG: HAMP domain-containing histidine kinase [Saccharofermentans sp.]|nr:HAMP domain-containing histidine kinase [Saccharofermentans sp.]